MGTPSRLDGEKSSKIGVLRWLKCILPATTLTMIYSAIVLPHFDYADSVYDSCTELDKTLTAEPAVKGCKNINWL